MLRLVCSKRILYANPFKISTLQLLHTSNSRKTTNSDLTDKKDDGRISGLAKALGKFRELEKSDGKMVTPPKEDENFLTLLRYSEFVQMGDPRGKVVVGKIFQVVNTDLYIDFGGKFFCVCRKPKKNSELYVRNAEVKLRINELELCARFLGATEDLTLTEASAIILDLISTPVSSESINKMERNN